MKPETKKFLDFNGQNINILSKDGHYWVAIRPICHALKVNYNRQFQNLKEDEILGRVFAIQQTHDASGRLQEMVCLPEKFVYGWLFSIKSKSEELVNYKLECYEVLFNYFHGTTTRRIEVLKHDLALVKEMKQLEDEVKESVSFKRLNEVKRLLASNNRAKKELDEEIKADVQLVIFD